MQSELDTAQQQYQGSLEEVRNEVSSRDKSILKLQSEVDTAKQQYQGSLEEVRNEV